MTDATPRRGAPARDRSEVLDLFRVYRQTRDRAARNELVELHRGLATSLARRFADRGEPVDDLVQVALLGLLKAVERFDPQRGLAFSSFATPTITGELKRHFRDKTWAVRVPRRAQELRIDVRAAVEHLHHELRRAPTIGEIARLLDVTTDEVIDASEATAAYKATSLSTPVGDDGLKIEDRLGDDPSAELARDATLRQVIATLPDRERRLIELRFFEDRTQSEIADELGISQMHVSRLLRRTFVELRERLGDDASMR
jgi:RNA polymerase sigma-B factor